MQVQQSESRSLYKRLVESLKHRILVARYRMIGAKGSWWDEKGPRQVEFLKSEGMKPDDYFLDVGCGPLRGGLPIIKYLNKGHYYGFDKEPALIRAGIEIELPRHKLVDKEPKIYHIDDFDISKIGIHFDYMLAFSVFNHLIDVQIEQAMVNLMPWLKSGGAFYVDYNEGNAHSYTKKHEWRPDEVRKSFFPFKFFEDLGKKYGFKVEQIEGWRDVLPDRSCLRFTK